MSVSSCSSCGPTGGVEETSRRLPLVKQPEVNDITKYVESRIEPSQKTDPSRLLDILI